jgi:hypothetical protein
MGLQCPHAPVCPTDLMQEGTHSLVTSICLRRDHVPELGKEQSNSSGCPMSLRCKGQNQLHRAYVYSMLTWHTELLQALRSQDYFNPSDNPLRGGQLPPPHPAPFYRLQAEVKKIS